MFQVSHSASSWCYHQLVFNLYSLLLGDNTNKMQGRTKYCIIHITKSDKKCKIEKILLFEFLQNILYSIFMNGKSHHL